MPAATPPDRYQPSFFRFPIQNDRTGFKPVYLPVILVVPGRRATNGRTLANSEVRDVKFFVADAPESSIVAGPFIYTSDGPVANNLLIPQLSRFVFNVPILEVSDVLISIKDQTFIAPDGTRKTYEDAEEGDVFEYTLIRGGTKSTIPYYPDADYHDMSLFTIDVEDLPRPQRYYFVWECRYNRRIQRNEVVAISDGSFCISDDDSSISQYSILINHPGEVHHEMFRKTPPFYFDNDKFRLAEDQLLAFYRPFADILQDNFEEQSFLNGINHINKVPAQLIPYLAYLVGWDLPNFPGASDAIRRAVLKQAVHLQKLKGSRRALIELFEIFGYTIDLINLWYSSDGKRLIAPDEALPDEIIEDRILLENVHQVDVMFSDYSESGFGKTDVPLLYKAETDIRILAYVVDPSNPVYDQLAAVADGIESSPDVSLANQIASIVPGSGVQFSEVVLDVRTGAAESSASSVVVPIINEHGLRYDPIKNIVHVTFDHYLDFSDGSRLFMFALYDRTKIVVPPQLQNLRSNRFDVKIFLKSGEQPSPLLLEFLLNFVFKLKSFHSLLRKIVFNLEFTEVYGVQDFCVDNVIGPPNTPGGTDITAGCNAGDDDLTDYEKEIRVLTYRGLLEEFKSWRALYNTHADNPDLDKFLNLPVIRPEGSSCQFTNNGQDRVSTTPNLDFDNNPDTRATVCADTLPLPPHCFKGRVQADVIIGLKTELCEIYHFKPCSLGIGTGDYWLYPQNVVSVLRNGFGQFKGQTNTGFLGTQISQYGKPLPRSLHYTNRPGLIDKQLNTDQLLAYRRPSLEIQKDNLWFPSHRFVRMSHIKDNFTHPLWVAKPWYYDDDILNARLETNTAGDEIIVYDALPLSYSGNGRDVDISSLGEHEDRSFLVTHKIYLKNKNPHPAITLDSRIVVTDDEAITFSSSTGFDPIFRSYNASCNADYISGYPAVTGRFTVNMDQYDFGTGSDGLDLATLLGLPTRSGTSTVSALFTLGSGILVTPENSEYRYYMPYRLDCECTKYGCDATGLTSVTDVSESGLNIDPCILNQFKDGAGRYDFNSDQLSIIPKIILQEKIGTCSTRLDGTIPNMLCIQEDGEIPANAKILPVGSFKYKDSYGNIYEGKWTFDGTILDISYSTKQPYVWGEPKQGYVVGTRAFVRGIITSYRQVYQIGTSHYRLIGNIVDQKIDFFQRNIVCGDTPFVDNFCFHVDCAVLDDVYGIVTCGPRWTELEDDQVVWPELVEDSGGVVVGFDTPSGLQPFQFVDVWGAETIISVCPTSTGSGS